MGRLMRWVRKAGDELARLENREIEEHIRERKKFANLSKDAAIGFRVQATVAGLAVQEYLQGRYRSMLLGLEKDHVVAQQNLLTAESLLVHGQSMQQRGYRSQLDIDELKSTVRQAELDVEIKKLEIVVLKDFTKAEELVTLQGDWEAAKAAANGHEEVLKNDEARIAVAREELARCVIRAPRDGLVIYPQGEKWKDEPEISEGSTAIENQVLLLMPDLAKMQVKVGIHESMVGKVKPGMAATVTLPHGKLEGKVSQVASVAESSGWWTGNIVKYLATIQLPPGAKGLKPGMSAEVAIRIAKHADVLTIPLAAVIETEEGATCWVGTPDQAERRVITLGDCNDVFAIVEQGLETGDSVVLDPSIFAEPLEDYSP